MKTLILLIGGTAGVGKTTIGKAVSEKYGIAHRIGTGFIREIVRNRIGKESKPVLFTYTFRSDDPVKTIRSQAKILRKDILSVIKRAEKEGTSIIIEGNHLLPELFYGVKGTVLVILKVSNSKKHIRMLKGKTHAKRVIDNCDVTNITEIQDYLIKTSERKNVHLIENESISKTTAQIVEILLKMNHA